MPLENTQVEVPANTIVPDDVFVRVKSLGHTIVSLNPPPSFWRLAAYLIARSAEASRFLSSFAASRVFSRLRKRVSDFVTSKYAATIAKNVRKSV